MARQKSIAIPITGINAPLRKALKESQKDLTAFGKFSQKWSETSALAYGIAGSAAIQFAADSVRAAMDDQKAQALLADQLKKTVGANEEAIKGAESYITTLMLATNVADDELRPALAQLVRVTGDVEEAQKLLAVAVDASIGSGRDLGSIVTAVSKAADGQTTALGRLGLGLSRAALNSGDLDTILGELNQKFGGAAAAAVDTTAGRIENLQLRFGELKEQIGTELLPVLEDVSTRLLTIAANVDDKNYLEAAGNVFVAAREYFNWASGINLAKDALQALNPFAADNADVVARSGEAAGASAAKFRILDQTLSDVTSKYDEMRMKGADYQKNIKDFLDSKAQEKYNALVEEYQEKQRKAAAAAQEAKDKQVELKRTYAENAKLVRQTLNKALEDSTAKLQAAKEAAQEFGDSFAYSFGVSLAGAYSDAKDAEDSYTDALKGRADAYAALDIAKQGDDLQAYLRAVQDVQAAETAVTAAQAQRTSPAAQFQKQIADAKTFGSNLKTLLGDPYNLGKAGLQQLLDLGPSAGAQITSDLIAGTAGFSVSDLNTSLADLAAVQASLSGGITGALGTQQLAAVAAAQSDVDALTAAGLSAPGVGQGIAITVNTGVGDPIAIGKQVQGILGQYDNRIGSIVTKPPKKKKRKK